MEDQVRPLVVKTWELFDSLPKSSSSRILIAVAGIPGSGKTTVARNVVSALNTLHHDEFHSKHPNDVKADELHPDIATAVPLDGYHLTRAQLAALPNAEEAVFRRGAAFTFDGEKFLALLKRIREPASPSSDTIYAASFDHAIKDPVENDIPIPPTSRIIIFEGNYLALNRPPWSEAAKLMDELWFVSVDEEVAVKRLVKRHVASGISPDEAHAENRVRQSDMRNGRDILDNRLEVQEIIQSKEDEKWKPETVMAVDNGEIVPMEKKDSVMQMAEDGAGC